MLEDIININLHVQNWELEDLIEDIIVNEDPIKEFIDDDLVKAFYTGALLPQLLPQFPTEQKILYTKYRRKAIRTLNTYDKQVLFWTKKGENDPGDALMLYEYVINNLFYNSFEDAILICLALGTAYGESSIKGNKNKRK